ncbi:MAG: flagellar filament capping protein FliD [Ignavibacteriales bacterium]
MVTRLTGLSSGLDIDSWVTDLMKAERTKVDTQYQKKQTLEWKRDNYRSINTKLLALRTASSDLQLQGTFLSKTAASSDSSLLTVTAGTSAVEANYTVKINSMASSATKSSTAAIGSTSDKTTLASQLGLSGNVTFTLEGKNGSKDFTFDTSNTSMTQMVNQINSANLGIKASYDSTSDRFFLMTTDSGSTSEIHVKADAENFLTSKLKLSLTVGSDEANAVKGTDASIDFNDATGLTFSSNQFTVNGLTINLKQASGSTTIKVENDTEAQIKKIKTFVEAYNNAMDTMSTELSAERDRDYTPLTDSQKEDMSEAEITNWETKAKTGLLKGDSLTMSVYNSLRSISYTQVEGLSGNYKTLGSVGISTASYSDKGKLYIDEDKLRTALTADPEGVMNLFTKSSTIDSQKGLAVKLYNSVSNGITRISSQAGSSSDYVDTSLIGKNLTDVSELISDLEDKLDDTEERYYRKFSAMEEAIQKFNSQSQYLSSMFSSSSNS